MPDYYSLIGAIRAQESRLLTPNRLQRMIGAESEEQALKILLELQYSRFVREESESSDFLRILRLGMEETKRLVERYIDSRSPESHFLWGKYDLINLSMALKKSFFAQQKIDANLEKSPQTSLSYYSVEALKKELSNLPSTNRIVLAPVYREVLKNFQQQKFTNWDELELALNKAYAQLTYQQAEQHPDPRVLEAWERFWAGQNFRSLFRWIALRKEPFPADHWISYDPKPYRTVADITDLEGLKRAYQNHPLGNSLKETNAADLHPLIKKVEWSCSRYFNDFLAAQSLGAVNDFFPVWNYVQTRLKNAEMIRLIMYSKAHGFSPEVIFRSLSNATDEVS